MGYWEIGMIIFGGLIFLVFSRDVKLPEIFYRREDTRRIRSYLDKKSHLNQMEFEMRQIKNQKE